MKKVMLLLLVSVLLLLVGTTLVTAKSDNAALIMKIDENICTWGDFEGINATGTVHYVETKNGKWKLTCIGEITEDSVLPDRAVQIKSTPDKPRGVCETPYGISYKWHETFTPSGRATLACQGDLTP